MHNFSALGRRVVVSRARRCGSPPAAKWTDLDGSEATIGAHTIVRRKVGGHDDWRRAPDGAGDLFERGRLRECSRHAAVGHGWRARPCVGWKAVQLMVDGPSQLKPQVKFSLSPRSHHRIIANHFALALPPKSEAIPDMAVRCGAAFFPRASARPRGPRGRWRESSRRDDDQQRYPTWRADLPPMRDADLGACILVSCLIATCTLPSSPPCAAGAGGARLESSHRPCPRSAPSP